MFEFTDSAQAPLRLYLDESGTLGFGGEVFTMAMVLVSDLARLENSIAHNKVTQAEIKASQMKTPQKLELAKKLLEENDLQVFLLAIEPAAASACIRKLDKELLYDSMIAQAMAYYLQRGDLPQGRAYRLSMDMRGGIRESFEDVVCESIGSVLMHREKPLVSDLQVRYMDSKYSAGVQVADLFSNIYRTSLSIKDSPCNGFLHKHMMAGTVHAGFSFGLRELADQMSQIASDLRARVEYEERNHVANTFRALPLSTEEQFEPVTTLGRVMLQGEAAPEQGTAGVGEPAGGEVVGAGEWVAGAPTGEKVAGEEIASAEALTAVEVADAAAGVAVGEGIVSADAWAASEAAGEVDNGQGGEVKAEASAPADEAPRTLSRSARRRRSRAARKAADAEAAAAAAARAEALAGEIDGANEQVEEQKAEPVEASVVTESEAQPEQAAPVKGRRPGWRAKAEVQAKAEKAAAKAKAGKKAGDAVTEASETRAEEKIGGSPAVVETQGKAEPVASETTAPEVAPEPASSADVAVEQAVVEGASGHTARERRQMAAQKSGAQKRTRKVKADGAQPEGEQVEAVASGVAETSSKEAAPVTSQVEEASSQPVTEEAKAGKPAAKRTRTRKAKPAMQDAPEKPADPVDAPASPADAVAQPDAPAPAPKPKRTRTRKPAAKPKPEAPAAE